MTWRDNKFLRFQEFRILTGVFIPGFLHDQEFLQPGQALRH